MVDPELLHAEGTRFGRRRSWVVLGVVLVLVVGLVVLRLGRSGPTTLPGPSRSPVGASSAPSAWPTGLPPGTLYAGAAGRVHAIDTRSGALRRTSVEADPVGTSMTRLADGVLVWRQGSRARQILQADGPGAYAVSGELRSATSFLPGPLGRVWARSGPGSDTSTWRLVDVHGRVTRSVDVDGRAAADGAGGLLATGRDGVRPVFPRVRRSPYPGQLVAAGPDGYVTRSCAEAECRFRLHQRSADQDTTTDTTMDTAVGEETSGGTLSPFNRLLAVTETVGGTSTVRVSVVATGEVKLIFPAPQGSTADAVWLDDRWLAVISEDRLVLYDAADDRVVTPDLTLSGIGPLAWRPA
jgi:hypothetical protein